MSLQARFDALRKLATLLEKKEEVPADLWASSGVKTGARLKDVQKEIGVLKKKVSAIQKEEHKPDSDEDEEEAAAKAKKEGQARQDTRVKEDRRRIGLDKKNLTTAVAMGEFDMAREYA